MRNSFATRLQPRPSGHPDLILDVRTPEEFADGHVPNAKNIPVHELPSRLHELGARDQSIVVYCRSGRRSASAAILLQRAGFTAVEDIGTMSAWRSSRD